MSCFPSAYLRTKILDKCLNNTDFTTPTAWYLALYTEDPTAAGTGDEVTGGLYARDLIGFSAASGSQSVSDIAANFTMPDCIVTHWGLLDALTAGNLLVFGALANPVSFESGDTIAFDTGSLSISLSGS